jgi:hypothetical protein
VSFVQVTVPGVIHGVVGGVAFVVVIALAVGGIALAVAALFSVLVSEQRVVVKLIWIFLILAAPVLGGLGWFLVGRKPNRNRMSSAT